MREWILGLQKAATTKGKGLEPMRWFKLEGGVNAVPDELRDLYEAFDGANLPPDVTLYAFFSEGGTTGIVEKSLEEPGWNFGDKNGQPLLTARKREWSGQILPDWAAFISDEDWLYAMRLSSGDYRFYRNLEQMLSRLVPPAHVEEFGDVTYAHALSAVEGLLGDLGQKLPRAAKKKASAKKKAAPKAPVKKKPAPKKAKVAKKAKASPRKKAVKKAIKKAVKKAPMKKKAKVVKKPLKKKSR